MEEAEKRQRKHGRRHGDILTSEVQRWFLGLANTIRWMARTVHQSRHQESSRTWQECNLSLCRGAREALKQARLTP